MRILTRQSSEGFSLRPLIHAAGSVLAAILLLCATGAIGEDATQPKEVVKDGYAVHQSIDLGGNIADTYGSGAMYDTLVNEQSGPRVLTQSLDLHAIGKPKYPFFDTLTTTSSGYGGGPINFTFLRMSKGNLYDFQGLYRRDRQYFDYNLLANPLVPAGLVSNGYTFPQVNQSPHYFNTVRRMLDTNLTLFPISKVSFRVGYSGNIMQGPTGSSVHVGANALLLQNWRNSTDTWTAGLDWKALPKTRLSFEEVIVHYKGDTNWQLAGLNLQLSNGTPVTIGYDNVSVPNCSGGPAILDSTTSPATANGTCNGFLQYSRYSPTRAIFPTEAFRFQSSSIKNVQMNGDIRYTAANMNLPNYFEYFNGNESRSDLRAYTITGDSTAKRIAVTADYGITWQVSKKFSISDQYNFWDFRQPGFNTLSEVDQAGIDMLLPPGAPGAPNVTPSASYLAQKTQINTLTGSWEVAAWAGVSLGYRYSARDINRVWQPDGTVYTVVIHENTMLLGVDLRPMPKWKINGTIEAGWYDNAYTQVSPRALQHYNFRTSYKPKDWATVSAAYNDRERQNDATLVDHKDHSRAFTIGGSATPNAHYGFDLAYGYLDTYSHTQLCYAATPAPPGAVPVPAGTGCGNNIYLGTGDYNAPTQYGSFGVTVTPIEKFSASVGYR
ncbi:MAG TPA: hypothetical protein VE195_05110, partial [Acidobacteriaceae bacterium]|nr:hypothetical protein [Acidobacteriaceae bacterium]